MSRRDIPVVTVFDSLTLLISCLSARLLSNLIVRLVDLFIVLEFLPAAVIRLVTLLIFSAGLLGFLSYKIAFRSAHFELVESLAAAGISVAVQFGLGILLGFTPWFFGATRHIAGFLAFGDKYNSNDMIGDIPVWILLAVGGATAVLYGAIILFGKYRGFRARLVSRGRILGESDFKNQ